MLKNNGILFELGSVQIMEYYLNWDQFKMYILINFA